MQKAGFISFVRSFFNRFLFLLSFIYLFIYLFILIYLLPFWDTSRPILHHVKCFAQAVCAKINGWVADILRSRRRGVERKRRENTDTSFTRENCFGIFRGIARFSHWEGLV